MFVAPYNEILEWNTDIDVCELPMTNKGWILNLNLSWGENPVLQRL